MARKASLDGKIKISVRLLPSTITHLREATTTAGFSDQISLYAQRLFEEYLPIVTKWQTVHGVLSHSTRHDRVTQTLTISTNLLYSYSLESVRLRMIRRTDLLESVLIIALGQKTEAIRQRSLSVEQAKDGRSLTIGDKMGNKGHKDGAR